ncbi:hypothetical protein Hanom_Chr15g01413071 [Helianthus anomalus]
MWVWTALLCTVTAMATASLVVKKTPVFIHKVSLLIFSRVEKQTGFACARTNANESLSLGVLSWVTVTRGQAWCEI